MMEGVVKALNSVSKTVLNYWKNNSVSVSICFHFRITILLTNINP